MRRLNKEEVIASLMKDRRLLTHVPDPTLKRNIIDRRGQNSSLFEGQRYEIEGNIKITIDKKNKFMGRFVNISDSGILIKLSKDNQKLLVPGQILTVSFKIPPGLMKEGYEHHVKVKAKVVRIQGDDSVALCFTKSLNTYFKRKIWTFDAIIAFLGIVSIVVIIIMMRLDLIEYLVFEPWLYGYSMMTAVYLITRYIFGLWYKCVPIDSEFEPGVSIIIPCFNEETWIQRTLLSSINQQYPIDKLEVVLVDDCSSDLSIQKVEELVQILNEQNPAYKLKERVKVIVLKENSGKREALIKGVEMAQHELVTFVDSDSFLDPYAILNLVQPFKDPKVGGVTGRTDVENSYTNAITKMQSVRYYIAFRILKAAESIFDAVTCLSGPISCYRRELIEEHKEGWLNQTFLGYPATFGDDRSMTNFILKDHRTVYQDSAVCKTIVPSSFKVFVKQQMRWKRSWLRESLRAGGYMWKKEPFQAISFYMGLVVPILAPFIFLYNVIYIPIVYHVFPTVFVIGILLMSFLMSFAYLFFRKSSLWIHGLWFCLFYECILLWQMPIACVTFWKSTWGTRETKADIDLMQQKQQKQQTKHFKGMS